ncbi:helix-turn-helix domain-containing protein, partial [Enterococcus faecalis]|uniref:helix-turn-helix domain-containing protein n=1 Tax=Enterococcus faecalis TaxID=1351 RepID=UPI003CC5CF66
MREIRTNLGFSMDEFGSLLGDSPRSSVNNWEKGVSFPKRDKLEKIAILGNMLPDQI